MPGYKFTSDLETEEGWLIDYWNLPASGVWIKALKSADELAILDNASCPFDEDGECERRGCLNEEGQRGWRMPIRGFLMMNERALAFVRTHPEKLEDEVTTSYGDGRQDILPGAMFAIPLLESFVERIKSIVGLGATTVTMWDRCSDPDAYPCPRSWNTKRPPNVDEVAENLKAGWRVPAAIIEEKLLSYDEAIQRQRNGEWEAMVKQVWGSESEDDKGELP